MQTAQKFHRDLLLSVSVHIIIGLLFAIQALFTPKSKPVEYQRAMRVDLVALPDKLPPSEASQKSAEPEAKPSPPQKLSAAAPKPEPSPAPSPAPSLKAPTKKAQAEPAAPAYDPKVATSAIAKLKERKSIEAKEQLERELERKKLEYKGAVMSQGTSFSGLEIAQMQDYIGELDERIKSFWELPEYLAANASLKAKVRLRILPNGSILSLQLVQPSSDPVYNEIVLETVRKAEPFPPPTEKFVSLVGDQGVVLGFPE